MERRKSHLTKMESAIDLSGDEDWPDSIDRLGRSERDAQSGGLIWDQQNRSPAKHAFRILAVLSEDGIYRIAIISQHAGPSVVIHECSKSQALELIQFRKWVETTQQGESDDLLLEFLFHLFRDNPFEQGYWH